MTQGVATTVTCGHPMRFYNLDRPRDDYAPVCHRPPHRGNRHMSKAAVEHERERNRRRAKRTGWRRRRQALILSEAPVSVTS